MQMQKLVLLDKSSIQFLVSRKLQSPKSKFSKLYSNFTDKVFTFSFKVIEIDGAAIENQLFL